MLESQDVYRLSDAHGFQYFPQAAIIYSAFAWLPPPVGEAAWRWCTLALFVSALWRLARAVREGEAPGGAFLLITLLVLPATLPSARNGQVNLKAELEIRYLHEMMDFLLKQQSQRLFALQDCRSS